MQLRCCRNLGGSSLHRLGVLGALVSLSLAGILPAAAQSSTMGAGTLSNLIFPRGGKVLHVSSVDPTGGNADMRRVEPGQTFTIMDYKGGPGIIRRWWITIAPRNNKEIQRQLIVRCYWDGETNPSVEVPVSDFFGMGFGEWRDYQSLPLNMTSGGYNCYWAMPFHKSARITVENKSKVAVDALYYNLDVETHKSLPKNTLYFHAQFRRNRPTVNGKPYTILETTGKGQYVGTLMSMQAMQGRGLGYLEGDEQVRVDGEAKPSIDGTGTEDYFSSGWYYDTGVYSAPYHGVTIKDAVRGRINTYRWHIEDPIPFEKSLKFDIEHGPVNDVRADYSSVAYYYQTHPHPPFPPLPRDLMPVEPDPIPKFPGLIEGEDDALKPNATGGTIEVQMMDAFTGKWSGDGQLWWKPKTPGEKLTLEIDSGDAGVKELIGYFTMAPDYGDIKVRVNGNTGDGTIFKGFGQGVKPSGPFSFGKYPFQAGKNRIEIELVGKNTQSSDYLVGIDGFMLKP